MSGDFNAVPEFHSVDSGNCSGHAEHQAGDCPKSNPETDFGKADQLEEADDGPEKEDLDHDPGLDGENSPGQEPATRKCFAENQRDTDIKKRGDESEGKNDDEEGNTKGDELSSGVPEHGDCSGNSHDCFASSCADRNEGKNHCEDQQRHCRHAESHGTMEAVGLVPIHQGSAIAAVGSASLFEKRNFVNGVAEMADHAMPLAG